MMIRKTVRSLQYSTFTIILATIQLFVYSCNCSPCVFTVNNTVIVPEVLLNQFNNSSCSEIYLDILGEVKIDSDFAISGSDLSLNKLVIRGNGSSELSCTVNPRREKGFMVSIADVGVLFIEDISFSNCSGGLFLSRIPSVSLGSSRFRDFSDLGCVTIHDCENVQVENVVFTDCHSNSNEVRLSSDFLGHSGGLTIITTNPDTQTVVNIRNVSFICCSSISKQSIRISVTDAFVQHEITGLGGGLGVFFFHYGSNIYQTTIENIRFTNCKASYLGGGMIMYGFGEIELEVLLNQASFVGNAAMHYTGGGLAMVHLPSVGMKEGLSATIKDSNFSHNEAPNGGGVFLAASSSQTSNITFENTCLESNSGGGVLSITSNISLLYTRPMIIFRDCVFSGVASTSGVQFTIENVLLVVIRAIAVFEGSNKFMNDTGTCFYVLQSKVLVKGTLEFSNSARALSIPDRSQVVMYRGSEMLFMNNTAFYGTGIYVGDTALLSGATKLLGKTVYNPLCFLQFEDPTLPPIHWDNVKLKFINLTSAIASVAFVNTFDFCSWTGNSKPFFEPEKFFLEWNFVTFEWV